MEDGNTCIKGIMSQSGMKQYADKKGMKADFCSDCKKSVLEQVFLRLLLLFLFLFLSLSELFHQVTLAVTMQPGLVPVNTKVFGNILLVNFKRREYQQPREVRGYH